MGTGKYLMIAFACTIMSGAGAHAGNGMLEIKSETDNPSADCAIKKLNEKRIRREKKSE